MPLNIIKLPEASLITDAAAGHRFTSILTECHAIIRALQVIERRIAQSSEQRLALEHEVALAAREYQQSETASLSDTTFTQGTNSRVNSQARKMAAFAGFSVLTSGVTLFAKINDAATGNADQTKHKQNSEIALTIAQGFMLIGSFGVLVYAWYSQHENQKNLVKPNMKRQSDERLYARCETYRKALFAIQEKYTPISKLMQAVTEEKQELQLVRVAVSSERGKLKDLRLETRMAQALNTSTSHGRQQTADASAFPEAAIAHRR